MLEIAFHCGGLSSVSLEQALGTAARLGFRYVALDSAHIDLKRAVDQPASEAAAIRELLREFHLELVEIQLDSANINAPEPIERDHALTMLEKLLPFVALLQPRCVTISAGREHSDGHDHSLARAVPGLLGLRRAMEVSAPGIALAVEPQPDSADRMPQDALKLLECVPGLRLTLDTGYLVYLGLNRSEMVALLPQTSGIHLRQAAKGRLQTAFALGNLKMPEWVADLKDANYQGTVAIQYLDNVWEHGALPLSVLEETVKTRDAFREARRALLPA
jgi:sugar phosphate isomerase/epimerase